MKKQNVWVAVAVVVIVDLVAGFVGFMMAGRPALQPVSGGTGGITITGTYSGTGNDIRGVNMDLDGDGKYETTVYLSEKLIEQFGKMGALGWINRMPKGTKVRFEECSFNDYYYSCKKKSVGQGAYAVASESSTEG